MLVWSTLLAASALVLLVRFKTADEELARTEIARLRAEDAALSLTPTSAPAE